MASTCLEQQLYLSNNNSLTDINDIDIPPHKLLGRRASAGSSSESYMADTMYYDSPRVLLEDTLFRKFLPYNNTSVDSEDEDGDPYAADHFRIYEFKVRKCTRSRSHDWTDCPFGHPGEKARRRCPRRFNYLGTVCADFRRGNCSRGDLCEFAHGVFECWLHPSKYRTEACKDGKNCQRKICFFAHTKRQLRVVPPEVPVKNYDLDSSNCCAHCRRHLDIHHTISPTSTLNIDLDKLSPLTSPPSSPARSGSGYSPISRFADQLTRAGPVGMTHLGYNSSLHNQSLNELMRSMDCMTIEENEYPSINSPWMDACFSVGGGGDQRRQLDNLSVINPSVCGSDMGQVFRSGGDSWQNVYSEGGNLVNDADLGWVNDLLT